MFKSLSKLFSIQLIAMQLILAPNAVYAASCYDGDEALTEQYEECKDSETMSWDETQCKCLMSEESTEKLDSYDHCAALEDDVEKRNCHEQLAKCGEDAECIANVRKKESYDAEDGLNITGDNVAEDFTQATAFSTSTTSVLSIANIIMIIIGATSYKNKEDAIGKCISKTIFMLASIGSLVAEAVTLYTNYKSLNSLVEGYSSLDDEAGSFDMQDHAYEYLELQHEKILDILKQKEIIYWAITAAYGLSAIIAALEIVIPPMKKCGETKTDNSNGGKGPDAAFINSKMQYQTYSFNNLKQDLEFQNYLGQIQKSQLIEKYIYTLNNDLNLNDFINSINEFNRIDNYSLSSTIVPSDHLENIVVANETLPIMKQMMIGLASAGQFLSPLKNLQAQDDDGEDKKGSDSVSFKTFLGQSIGGKGVGAAGILAAGGGVAAALGVMAAISANGKAAEKTIGQLMGTSPGIAILGAASAVVSAIGAGMISKRRVEAKDAHDAVVGLREKFLSLAEEQSCIAADANAGQIEARCYCACSGCDVHPSMTNSETCVGYCSSSNICKSLFAEKSASDEEKVPTGCVRIDGEFDPECNCRKLKDEYGNTACLKADMATISGLGSTGQAIPQSSVSAANSLGDGSGIATANSDALVKAAAKQKKMLETMLPAVNAELATQGEAPLDLSDKNLSGLLKKLTPDKETQGKISGLLNAATAAAEEKNDGNEAIKKALDKVKKKAGYEDSTAKKADAKKKFAFKFGDDSPSSQSKVTNFGNEAEYDFKDNDIVDRKDVSIFKIITNRYNTSGLRRLFEDDE